MWASRFWTARYWAERYWPKTGSDIAHSLTATVWLVPARTPVQAPRRRDLHVTTRAVIAVDRRRHG